MIQEQDEHYTNFVNYKRNFFQKEAKSAKSDSKENRKQDFFNEFGLQFLKFSILWNSSYFLSQIVFFAKEKDSLTAVYSTIGLYVLNIALISSWYLLDAGLSSKVRINLVTHFLYLTIYIHFLGITFRSFFLKERLDDRAVNVDKRFLDLFYFILSGFLMFLSCEINSIFRHKILINFYFISSIGIIISNGLINEDFLNLAILLVTYILLLWVMFSYKNQEHLLSSRLEETYSLAEKTFGYLQSVTKSLNSAIFLFKNEKLFFHNEIGKDLIDSASIGLLEDIKHNEQENKSEDSQTKTNKINENNLFPIDNQKIIHSMFSNLLMYEDSLKIQELFGKCKTDCTNHNTENALKLEFKNREESRLDLYSIFQLLIIPCSFSYPKNTIYSDWFSQLNQYVSLGIFKLASGGERKKFFEIIIKIEYYPTGEKEIEFIFKDVSSHYELLTKMDDINLNFKKNAHEFKTPILSLLGCAEELVSHLNSINYVIPEMEKSNIKAYLDHVVNLCNYIGYLIKGLTKSSKEANHKSNSVSEYKEIKLNPLLNFCLNILKSLMGCDSEKSKNIKAELKNDLVDYNASFRSNEVQVKQILLNFISNSVKFTHQGKIAIKAKTKKKDQKIILMIIIKDTGCGIKKEDKSKLFQEYSKFNNSENNTFGTGLGLNICKSMADNLKMKIKFKSEENAGTKVILSIFDPIIEENEIFLENNNKLRMSDSLENKNEFSLKTSEDLNLGSHTLMLEHKAMVENDTVRRLSIKRTAHINSISSCTSSLHIAGEKNEFLKRRNINDSIVTPIRSEVNYSMVSYLISQSSKTFDVDANNQKSTHRLSRSHDYGIKLIEKKVLTQYIPEFNSSRNSLLDSENKQNQFLSIENLRNNLRIPTTIQTVSQGNIYKSNEIKTDDLIRSDESPNVKSPGILFATDKILVVDDQLHARRALINIVTRYVKEKKLNFDIIELCDGIDCLKTVITYPSNVKYIFIDENMNYMNGTQTGEIIRRLSGGGKISKIKLILVTADDNFSLRQNIFNFCVSKPVSRENIEEILE